MDDARKLLDSLMGPSRDKDKRERKRNDGWKERNVCKRYLIGCCPNHSEDNWFKNTRGDMGVCEKIHSEALKQQFEQHPERDKFQADYERELLRYLEGIVSEADSWISKEKKNLKANINETRIPPEVKKEMDTLKELADSIFKKAEEKAESGDLEGSKRFLEEANRLNRDIEQFKADHTWPVEAEEVCDVCGVRCQPHDIEVYKAHFEGKLHEGYARIRQKVKDLREKQRQVVPASKAGTQRRSSQDGEELRERERREERRRSRSRGVEDGDDFKERERRDDRRRSRSRSRERRRDDRRDDRRDEWRDDRRDDRRDEWRDDRRGERFDERRRSRSRRRR